MIVKGERKELEGTKRVGKKCLGKGSREVASRAREYASKEEKGVMTLQWGKKGKGRL